MTHSYAHDLGLLEKSRDWMLRRLRKAKKQYNLLLKGPTFIPVHIHLSPLFNFNHLTTLLQKNRDY